MCATKYGSTLSSTAEVPPLAWGVRVRRFRPVDWVGGEEQGGAGLEHVKSFGATFGRPALKREIASPSSVMNSGKWPKAIDESLPEIDLYENSKERKAYDNLADLYAIITATEHLERAYANDAITQAEYTRECSKLLSQFKITENAALGKDSMTTETFMRVYQMDCPRAAERLLRMGVPEPTKTSGGDANVAMTVKETTQHFITAMDAVKLDQRAVDELQPLLSDLMSALIQLPDVPNDFAPNHKVRRWLEKLNSMRAVDMIDDDDSRQLYHDLDSSYTEFERYLRAQTR